MMRLLRGITMAVFAVVLCLFVMFSWKERSGADHTFPEISMESPELEVSIDLTEEDLLRGMTAQDGKDGDLTGRILVESVSQFIEPGVSKATYAVCDSDNHVAKAERMIRFRDYTSPRFYLHRPLVFGMNDPINIRAQIGAADCMEGDISSQVTIVANDYAPGTEGLFTLVAQVTNRFGDISELSIPLVVEEQHKRAPQIELRAPLIYVKKGTQPDFAGYISGVSVQEVPMEEFAPEIVTDFNPNVPGVYAVHYYVTGPEGLEGHTILTAVVEE